MPSAQIVDFSPIPRRNQTNLEKTLAGFSNQHSKAIEEQRQMQMQNREADSLRDIYDQYKNDGQTLEDAIMAVQTRHGLSPTARVNNVNALLNMQKYNSEIQKKAKEDLEKQEKKNLNQKIIEDIEDRRGLERGALAAYVNEPKMADQITRPQKLTQASQPVNPDQQKRIDHVMDSPDFEGASLPQKNRMLMKAGVSKENTDAIMKPYYEEGKVDKIRSEDLAKHQAKNDADFYDEQVNKMPGLIAKQQTIQDANALNEKGVTGGLWDQMMQTAGLMQFTSDGYRLFTSFAKDMVKNQDIKGVIGSQISQMEFGFFRDATINPNFTKEANRQILRKEELAVRYQKLYSDIAAQLVDQNDGVIPEKYQAKVNEEFAKQSEKISKELKETFIDFEAIQNVPPGHTLMYDKKRRPLHVKNNEVAKYTKLGATSS